MPVFSAAESEYVQFVEVTTRTEVEEDTWDSDGTWTHSTSAASSTAQTGRADKSLVIAVTDTEAPKSSWLHTMQSNMPKAQDAALRRNLDGLLDPEADASDRAAKFAQFAESIDDGICRLAAVAIAQNALNVVKARLYTEAAVRIQAAERGRQARKRFRSLLAKWRAARLRRLLENAAKLGVLTVLLIVLVFLWMRESAPVQCLKPPTPRAPAQCRPPRAPAPAPAPPPPPLRVPKTCRAPPSSGR